MMAAQKRRVLIAVIPLVLLLIQSSMLSAAIAADDKPVSDKGKRVFVIAHGGGTSSLAKELGRAFAKCQRDLAVSLQNIDSRGDLFSELKSSRQSLADVIIWSGDFPAAFDEHCVNVWKSKASTQLVAVDVCVAITNMKNSTLCLSRESIRQLCINSDVKEPKRWLDFGGAGNLADQEVVAVMVPPTSYFYGTFFKEVLNASHRDIRIRSVSGHSDVLKFVVENENAIGFLRPSYIDSTVRVVEIDGQAIEFVKSLDCAKQLTSKCVFAKKVTLITSKQAIADANSIVGRFAEFVISPTGREICKREGLELAAVK